MDPIYMEGHSAGESIRYQSHHDLLQSHATDLLVWFGGCLVFFSALNAAFKVG